MIKRMIKKKKKKKKKKKAWKQKKIKKNLKLKKKKELLPRVFHLDNFLNTLYPKISQMNILKLKNITFKERLK